jgi:hypothetical protein
MAKPDKLPISDYVSPQPTFVPCAFCECLVMVRRDARGDVETYSPLLGYRHECGENCACAWQEAPETAQDALSTLRMPTALRAACGKYGHPGAKMEASYDGP